MALSTETKSKLTTITFSLNPRKLLCLTGNEINPKKISNNHFILAPKVEA